MVVMLNREENRRLFDEDIKWLMKQPRTLVRDHICECLTWLRDESKGRADAWLAEKQGLIV